MPRQTSPRHASYGLTWTAKTNEALQRDTVLGLLSDDKLRPRGVPKPTAFWFTGGGYQAIWRMAEPVPAEEAEAHNRALLVAFRGKSGPIDVSRLLRLPGSVNWLSDNKRAAGREPAKTFLMEPLSFAAAPVTYTLKDFQLRLAKGKALASQDSSKAPIDIDGIEPLPLPDDLGDVIPLDPV